MHLITISRLGFAAAVVLATVGVLGAWLQRGSRQALGWIAGVLLVGTTAEWVAFALRPSRELAVAALGTSTALLLSAAAVLLGGAVRRGRDIDAELEAAHASLRDLVKREIEASAAELERVLARARADSSSRLREQERELADERRSVVSKQEGLSAASLAEALRATQTQIERRLAEWNDDLTRVQQRLGAQVHELGRRQQQLIAEAEARIASDAERLESESDAQRSALVRLREELMQASKKALESGGTELDTFAAERRRALHELGERLRVRERVLREQVEREESEATGRIKQTFNDVERRQVEQLERTLARAAQSYSEAAGLQFESAAKSAREEAAQRLARELDRAVQSFTREAQRVLAGELAQVGEGGTRRLERRLSQLAETFERQREEAIGALGTRLGEAEHELRQRLGGIAAEGEAERAVLDARLAELGRRVEEAVSRAEQRLAALESVRAT